MDKNIENSFNFDSIDTWINKEIEIVKYGVLGVDYIGSHGVGRWEMILDEDGIPHIYTEHMDDQNDKSFSEAILKAILDKAIIED